MSDDDQSQGNNQIIPDGEQVSPMPSEEQVQPTESEPEVEGLPEEASERTKKEFEKLKESNQKLHRELEELKGGLDPDTVDAGYRPQSNFLTDEDVDRIAVSYTDEYGNVDVAGLQSAVQKAELRAKDAERRVSLIEKRERDRMVKEAHAKHPYLDPRKDNPEFDPVFYRLVRDEMVDSMRKGYDVTLTDVADKVLALYQPKVPSGSVEVEKAKAVEDYKQSQQAKAQVSASSPNQKRADDIGMEELRTRTRQGDKEAFAERLRRAGL